MSNLLQKAGKAFGYLGGGLTLITFIQGTQQNKHNKVILESLNKRVEMQESIINKYESAIQQANDYTKLSSKVSDINEITESALRESSKLTDLTINLQDPNLNESQVEMIKTDLSHHSSKLEENITISNNKLEELNNMLQDIFSSNSKNKFIDGNIFDNLQNYLVTLPLEKVGALGHILISFAILLSIISIVSVFYGEFLITYFNLETKFPRIARFIKIRRKFQLYYFTFNIFAIILALLLIIYVNIVVFLS
jgi:hypothetical protein